MINQRTGIAVEPNFLEYYNRELTFLRAMSQEFADTHPAIAARLGMKGIEVADPYVERLIETFCFLSARTRLKIDAGFPVFTQRLLDVIYPNYTSPVPSMAIARLSPDLQAAELTRGYTVPRDTVFRSPRQSGSTTRCEYRNCQPVTLWPMTLSEAELGPVPGDLPVFNSETVDMTQCKGVLRIRLQLEGERLFSELEGGPECLPVYIQGEEHIVSHLFELLHQHTLGIYIPTGEAAVCSHIFGAEALTFEGLKPEHSLLPAHWNIFHGQTLVQEYLCFRQRFYFFTLTHLAAGLTNQHSNQVDLYILLRELPQPLISHVDAGRFLLFCTPVINLFPKQLDQIDIHRSDNSFHAIVDRCHPQDYEIFSVHEVTGLSAGHDHEITFNPLYQTRHSDHGNFGRYFSLQRKTHRQPSGTLRTSGPPGYQGTDVFISLVDQHEAPYRDDLRYLRVAAMVTNRDLPCRLSGMLADQLTLSESIPVSGAAFVGTPSAPREPLARGESAWQLIHQLSVNYLPLANMSAETGAEALRSLLRLQVSPSDAQAMAQINSLVECTTEPVVRRLAGDGLLIYGRGVRCHLTVDEQGFSGCSPYLFGLIMENYLSRHASVNVFTETRLYSVQRGFIGEWQARQGRRGIL